jgi:ABC-type amino acid transport substrate-binding protein
MSNIQCSADELGEQGARQSRALARPVVRFLHTRLAGLVAAALVANFFLDSASAATTTSGAQPPLRVVTLATAPFVLPRTDPPAGFSVDLWNEVVRRMHVDFTWQVVRDPAQVLTALQSHDADVAIGAIAVTPESEQVVDFSVPYFDSGLRIMVRTQYEAGVVGILRSIPWIAIGHLFAVAIVLIFLLANVLWLIERRRRELPRSYLAAIGEELWGAMLVIATLNVDRDAPGIKRVTILLMWLVGVVLIAQLTATVTSTQTIARMQSLIRGPEDLPGKTIASVPGTAAGDYLAARGLPFTSVTYGPDGIRMLVRGEVQAVVFDAATLQYWAAKQGKGVVQVVGPLFRPQKYAIAVAVGSQLRKQINRALLEIYADGTYERIYSAWFSVAP